MKEKIKKLFAFDEKNPYIPTIVIGLVLALVMECFNQRSFIGGFSFLFANPLMFVVNAMLIITSFSLALLFHKRRFFLLLISIAWMVLIIANFIIRTFRTTPLRAIDFRVAKSVVSIVSMYLSVGLIIFLAVLIIAAVAALVVLFIKSKWIRPKYIRAVIAILISVGLTYGSVALAQGTGALPDHFDNLTNAYTDNGFTYCFLASIFDNGISKPDTYSEENINRIIEENTVSGNSSSRRPNIIYVQLESFYDVSVMKNYTYSEDPTPNINKLKETCGNGKLTVASFGTGTANTEFDILTSMNVQCFGAGEYPYSTVLRKRCCESMSYALKDLGYQTHAVHDHLGNFYARNKVYPRLGFDSFTSVEYMSDVERNVLGWADDSILTGEILKCLDSTEESDFVFTVSVQPHGRYSEEVIDDTQTITMEGAETEGEKNAFEYYINQLHQTDEFVGELCDALNEYDEPVVVVFYGDHLPNIGMTDEDLVEGSSIYETEYVIWSNQKSLCKMFDDRDLATYQMSAYVYSGLGFKDWIVAGIHASHDFDLTDEDYLRDLKMVEYDILYGKKYLYGDGERRTITDMQMGILPITITEIIPENGGLRVKGENFTESSVIAVGSDKLDTEYISSTELFASGVEIEIGDKIRVMQMANRTALSRTEDVYYLLGVEDVVKQSKKNEKDAKSAASGHMIIKKEE